TVRCEAPQKVDCTDRGGYKFPGFNHSVVFQQGQYWGPSFPKDYCKIYCRSSTEGHRRSSTEGHRRSSTEGHRRSSTEGHRRSSTEVPQDCSEVRHKKGVQWLEVKELGFDTYCDYSWTVIQQRKHGTVNFYRNWSDYLFGFGDPEGDFWVGLEKMFRLSLVNHNSDGLSDYNNMAFTTADWDNDKAPYINCAIHGWSGWWFNNCGFGCNLNGIYERPDDYGNFGGFLWMPWTHKPLKHSVMKIRMRGYYPGFGEVH
ncbi:hypothetical protein BaRGS_00029250, partial [Batillaria attramentaria]